MLKALESGKHRGLVLSGLNDASDRKVLLEDLLTAVVFGRLSYLADEHIARVLRGLLPKDNVDADDFGDLIEFTFWPTLELNRLDCTVEPDVIIEFENCVFAVEAKRVDGQAMQSAVQLSRQAEALSDNYAGSADASREINLIALGGHRAAAPLSDAKESWVNASWRQLWESIASLELETPASMRIRHDILVAFKLHGVSVRDPLFFGTLEAVGLRRHSEALARIRSSSGSATSIRNIAATGFKSNFFINGEKLSG